MNSSNPVTKLYTTLDLTILSELIRAILKIHGSANMIYFKYTWKDIYIYFVRAAAEEKVKNEICINNNTDFLLTYSISNFLMSYWKNVWPRLELKSIKSDDILQ